MRSVAGSIHYIQKKPSLSLCTSRVRQEAKKTKMLSKINVPITFEQSVFKQSHMHVSFKEIATIKKPYDSSVSTYKRGVWQLAR